MKLCGTIQNSIFWASILIIEGTVLILSFEFSMGLTEAMASMLMMYCRLPRKTFGDRAGLQVHRAK